MGLNGVRNAQTALTAVLAGSILTNFATAAPYPTQSDPFAVLDPQIVVLPDNMTWADYVKPPGTTVSNPQGHCFSFQELKGINVSFSGKIQFLEAS